MCISGVRAVVLPGAIKSSVATPLVNPLSRVSGLRSTPAVAAWEPLCLPIKQRETGSEAAFFSAVFRLCIGGRHFRLSRMKARVIIVAVLLSAALLLGLWLGFAIRNFTSGNRPTILNTATVLQQVQTLAQLVTVKYVMEKVVVYEDVKWFPGGENRVMLVAHGIVKAGVDLQRMKPEDVQVDDAARKVTIRLPVPQITDSYLDDSQTQVVERSTGLLRSFDKDLEQLARQIAVDDIRRAARYAGILKDADERARLQVRAFFQQIGWQVEFVDR